MRIIWKLIKVTLVLGGLAGSFIVGATVGMYCNTCWLKVNHPSITNLLRFECGWSNREVDREYANILDSIKVK